MDRDFFNEIWDALTKNAGRTILTALGVFWGILMLIIMLGAGNGLQNGVKQDFSGFATNSIFLWAQSTSKPYAGLPPGRNISMTNDDVEAIRNNVSEIELLAPRNQLGGYRGGNNVIRGEKTGAFDVMGDYPQLLDIQSNIKIEKGRYINHLDIENNRKVVIIGPRAEEVLFDREEDPIGKSIQINGVYFMVVGVFDVEGTSGRAERDAQSIYIPFTTFQRAFNYGNRVGWMAITAKENKSAAVVEEKVVSLLKSRHKVAPEDDRAFGHFNAAERFAQMNNLFLGIQILIWIVGTGTLLAGVIGVSNIMLIIVKERTREIGIRRAIGATPLSIMKQIMTESVVLTIIAGYFGLSLGVAVLEVLSGTVSSDTFKNPEVDFQIAIAALIILAIAGLFAGMIPARRAVQVRPVEALRHE